MVKKVAKERLLVRVRKSPDLETHVRVVEVEEVAVVEFRDYIPSLAEYGRGYWLPMDDPGALREIGEALLREATP